MMTSSHYRCAGECQGVSSSPGACRAEECSMRGEPLEKCECEDAASHNLDDGENPLKAEDEDEEEEEV